ncbi:MAG: hypothetical protein L3J65_09335 [Robiginitomaculum sp.]|nr:hypothetical protein [Robiginitomaculum sp.]
MGIKKKIFLGWVALEAVVLLIGLPAAAQIVDRVMFTAAPRAAHAVTPIAPGLTEIMVASNAPFTILSEGAVGEMSLMLTVSGTINGKAFGGNAQDPGQIEDCVLSTAAAPTALYTATRRTAANRGEVIGQAVMVHIKYDPSLTPKFSVQTLDHPAAKSAALAMPCQVVSS